MAENQKHQQTDKEKKPQKHSHQEAGRVAAQQSGHLHQLTDEGRRKGSKAAQEGARAHHDIV